MFPRDFSIIPFISLFSLMLQQLVSAGKRWHILNVPKKNLSIIPFISLFFLILQQQVSVGKRWHILNVPKKTFPSFFSSQHVPKRFFHHSLHLLVLLDALTSSLCRKRWCILNVPKKTFHHPLHLSVFPRDFSIIPFISSFSWML